MLLLWESERLEMFSEWFNPIRDKYLSRKSIEVVTYEDTDIDLSDSNKNRKIDFFIAFLNLLFKINSHHNHV